MIWLILFILMFVVFTKLSDLNKRVGMLEDSAKDKMQVKNIQPLVPPAPANADVEPKSVYVDARKTMKMPQATYEIVLEESFEIVPEVAPKKVGEISFETYDKKEEKVKNDKDNKSLEFKLGSRIFTGIGAVAITFAVGYFLRYAFENNLITETMRVVLGVLAGLVLLAIGELSRKKYENYGQILTGAGLGILYLSLYSAFSYYHIMSQEMAFFWMIIITAIGVTLAVRYNSLI